MSQHTEAEEKEKKAVGAKMGEAEAEAIAEVAALGGKPAAEDVQAIKEGKQAEVEARAAEEEVARLKAEKGAASTAVSTTTMQLQSMALRTTITFTCRHM